MADRLARRRVGRREDVRGGENALNLTPCFFSLLCVARGTATWDDQLCLRCDGTIRDWENKEENRKAIGQEAWYVAVQDRWNEKRREGHCHSVFRFRFTSFLLCVRFISFLWFRFVLGALGASNVPCTSSSHTTSYVAMRTPVRGVPSRRSRALAARMAWPVVALFGKCGTQGLVGWSVIVLH